MGTCDMGYDHDDPAPAPEPEADLVIIDQGPNENDVKIAEIEAAASVEREKIWTEQRGADLEQTVAELRGELTGMREVLDRLQPPEPPEPDPVVLPLPDPPAPAPEPAPAPPPAAEPKASSKKSSGWWG